MAQRINAVNARDHWARTRNRGGTERSVYRFNYMSTAHPRKVQRYLKALHDQGKADVAKQA